MPDPEAVIKTKEMLAQRKGAFMQAFGKGPGSEAVLEDLAKFCRANESCFHPDPRIHAALEGRREVYLRIMQHLDLTTDQLYELYTSPKGVTHG